MAVKPPSTYSDADRNWHWPEKTWFRERLNAIKAQEQQGRRKPTVHSTEAGAVTPAFQSETDALKVG
jgi:hypothetical protein